MIDYTNLTDEQIAKIAVDLLNEYKNADFNRIYLQVRVGGGVATPEERKEYDEVFDKCDDLKWNAILAALRLYEGNQTTIADWLFEDIDGAIAEIEGTDWQ